MTSQTANETDKLQEQVASLTRENARLERQLAWFQRQLFGRKSEKREFDIPMQDRLFDDQSAIAEKPQESIEVPAHKRKKKTFPGTPADSGLRFNENEVDIKDITLSAPELTGSDADQYEIIRYEHTYRLAQQRGSVKVLRYKRPVLKHKDNDTLISTPAPDNVFGKSYADVSFVVAMLIDKCVYHLPLYRQHLRLKASYVEISRATLTNLFEKAAQLLEPVAGAVLASILQSHLITMDETPTKAGHTKKKGAKHGQMRKGWFWPLMGDQGEVYFHFSPSRSAEVVQSLLSGFEGTLLTDGYSAYESYASQTAELIHALCWVHSRRGFERALDDEPVLANQAMDMIGALYAIETHITEKKLNNADKLAYRGEHSKDIVDKFFIWCTQLVDRPDLLATESPILDAVNYVLKREKGLRAYLSDPQLPMDTNHIERELRVIPCGRKNWNFNWTEVGAHHLGIIQTLLCSCKLQGVDPYTYLVDVMQRVAQHPAKQVDELIPRNWKEKFAGCPLKSDLEL